MNEEPKVSVVVSIPRELPELAEEILLSSQISSTKVEGAGFDGGGELLQLLCTLGTAGIGALVAILRGRLARAKDVSIEVGGMKVTGADPDKVEALLKMMIAANRKQS